MHHNIMLKRNKHSAFSLVELLITVAILSILGTVIWSSFTGTTVSFNLKVASNKCIILDSAKAAYLGDTGPDAYVGWDSKTDSQKYDLLKPYIGTSSTWNNFTIEPRGYTYVIGGLNATSTFTKVP